jgi:flavodoxin
MKVLIAYYSQTGNTAQVARAIHEQVVSAGHKAHLKEIGEVTSGSLGDYDLVFLGSACHSTDLAAPVKAMLREVSPSPPFKLAGFVTHATLMPDGDDGDREQYERWASKCIVSFEKACQEAQIEFLGYFHCLGAPSPPIEVFIHNTIVTDADEWAAYIEQLRKHPDDEDLHRAKAFARQILAKC